jgi:ABC-2 type transport system permease protein
MTKLWALTRVNVMMALYQMSLVRRRIGRREGRGFAYGIAILVVFIMGYWGFWSWSMMKALHPVHYEWVLLTMTMLIMSVIVLGLGFYSFNSLLFESADTDQLFAYPLSKLTVIAGKVSGLVAENWVICLVFWLPTVAVYAYYVHPGVVFYLFALVIWLVIPGIPLFVLGLISYIVGVLASGPRLRRILSVVLTLALVAGIGIGVKTATTHLMTTANVASVDDVLALLQRYYPPVGYATAAIARYSWGDRKSVV